MLQHLQNHSSKFIRSFTLSLLLSTTALYSAGVSAYFRYDGPGLINLPPGSRLVVNQDLAVDRGARIHIQNGHVLDYSDVTKLEPYCYFYSSRDSNEMAKPFLINKSEFKIKRLNRRRDIVAIPNIRLASLGFSGFGDGGGAQYTLATEFVLEAPNQPDVSSMVCAIWADPREQNHLSLKEIQQTLSGLAEITGQSN